MGILLGFIGVLALLGGIFAFTPFAMNVFGKAKAVFGGVLVLASLTCFLLANSLFWAEAGIQYFVIGPTGTKTAITTEGYHFVTPTSTVQPWTKYIDVKVVGSSMKESDLDEIEGKMAPIGIRFIDQVTALAAVSVRFQIPSDAESFIKMVIKFRSMSNLVNNTLIPTVKEQMINTGYMYAAQDYISGDAQRFRQTFEEQLMDGAYSVSKTETKDTIYDNSSIQTEGPRRISEVKIRYNVQKLLRNGKPVRIPHEITSNNIVVSQVIVDQVALEKTFKQRLEAQRDESAKRQLEQQKVKTAKDAQLRIIAEGESAKAAERVKQEKAQVATLINIETKLKEEATNQKLALIKLETAKIDAKSLRVSKDAEAYANRQLVNAGLTPRERATIDKDTKIGVARELAKMKLPSTMVIGGGSKGKDQSNLFETIGVIKMLESKTIGVK